MAERTVSLVVPRKLVKTVKSALEAHGSLSREEKIVSAGDSPIGVECNALIVPTKLSSGDLSCQDHKTGSEHPDLGAFFEQYGLGEFSNHIRVTLSARSPDVHPQKDNCGRNKLGQIVGDCVSSYLEGESFNHEVGEIASDFRQNIRNCTYMIYPPLLLLPPHFFSQWPSILIAEGFLGDFESLYQRLCPEFQVTHIALNGTIPVELSLSDDSPRAFRPAESSSNILRSPTNLTPLYGHFGPLLPVSHKPSPADFDQAFWCTARQNKIFQTWAPRYTMFSRGNITEKARILHLDTLKATKLGCLPEETSAVDLYAGIGYFAFSYARAGVGKVLCWEINPWSIEGLRRGAKGNGWTVIDELGARGSDLETVKEGRIIAFKESNERARETVAKLRDSIPPIRHVNCGYLPSSRDSWKTAVNVLDPKLGGWIHAHENIAKADIESRKIEIVATFEDLVRELLEPETRMKWAVNCESFSRIKSYAPGVLHCVLDIAVTIS